MRYPGLSKSKLVSCYQCPKKLHFEWHYSDLAEVSADAESRFRTGHEIGAIAQAIYGTEKSVEIPYQRNMQAMADETTALIEGGADFPIFEATFIYEGVVVRVDVLIPEGGAWRAVEIKASTKVKPEHRLDCAIQWWVMRGAGLPVKEIALGHVNNGFVYAGDGDYSGLITEEDLTEEAKARTDEVVDLLARSRQAVMGEMPDVQVGVHCNKPYECDFRAQCWPTECEYPVNWLGGSKAKHAEWVNRGLSDIRDIPADEIKAEKQQRIYRITCSGEAECRPGAKDVLDALDYPRYYLDFETIGPAVPIWAGTRPYQSIPIQWSIHIDDGNADGSLERMQHEEFLDLSGKPPMRALAERMIECLGESGPVLMYTDYELGVIKNLIAWFPDLETPLQAIIGRLFDLHPVVEEHYYHPCMAGSWSIKSVAPALAPHMDYKNLEGINVGTAASEGYLEAIRPDTSLERKAELQEQLLRYCRFDTAAMVAVVSSLSAK